MGESFGVRLRAASAANGPLCAGVDPHPGLLAAWGLPHSLAGIERFAATCVEAFAGNVAVVKPQSAFFEVFGSAGVAVLERVLTDLDRIIGLSGAPTDLAAAQGRGVFVLALTSNPEGTSVQHARSVGGRSVAGHIVDGATADNAAALGRGELGHVGLVVGATVGSAIAELDLDLAASGAPILAPGLGAQGATPQDLRRVFGAALPNVLASASRSILTAGPDVNALRAAARAESEALVEVLAQPR